MRSEFKITWADGYERRGMICLIRDLAHEGSMEEHIQKDVLHSAGFWHSSCQTDEEYAR